MVFLWLFERYFCGYLTGIVKRQKSSDDKESVRILSKEAVDEEYKNQAEIERTKDIFDEVNVSLLLNLENHKTTMKI